LGSQESRKADRTYCKGGVAAIAQETGETMTRVVTKALQEWFERLPGRRGKASVEELRAIARRAAAYVKGPYLDRAEFLYDENGLPK